MYRTERVMAMLGRHMFEILNAVSGLMAIWMFVIKDYKYTAIALGCAAVFLGLWAHNYRKDYRDTLKSYNRVYQMLSHLRREILTSVVSGLSSDPDEALKFSARHTMCVLNEITTLLSDLSGEKCTGSLMAPDTADRTNLKTVEKLWSRETPWDRRDGTHDLRIPIGKGFAGIAFDTRRIKWSSDFSNEKEFLRDVHADWGKYYRSGFSAPVFVNDRVELIFNIDCMKPGVFNKEMCTIVNTGAELLGLVLQISGANPDKGVN